MAFKFTWSGVDKVLDNLRKQQREMPQRVERALYTEAQIDMTESKRRVPVDTGVLRATGAVQKPERSGRRISVRLTYGTEYAVFVHEDLDAFHKIGQAKFLESVLNESRPHMAARLARRINIERPVL